MSLTILKSTQQLSLHSTDALIRDNNDIIITNDLHTATSHLTDNKSYGVSENSCSDNNDNSLNVTGDQNLVHICVGRDAYGDVSVSEPYQQKQTQQKALNLNGNEMRHRKNLLFNLINAIMNYLGNSNKNSENNRHEGNTIADDDNDDRIDDSGVDDSSDKLIIMDEYDRLSSASSCDNRSKKVDLNEKELEYAFSDETDVETLKDDQNERALVPEGDSFGVTLR